MSEAMIKRWNEIPLDRSEGPVAASSSKRARARSRSPSSSDESEDNVSIVSRSPSPVPQNQKEEDISIYDQYVRGVAREPVTVDTKIAPTNKGFGMLAKMGWKEGEGLGVSGQGRTDPIPFLLKLDALGLGKASHDDRIIESTVSQRRGLDSERMIKETEEQRKQREDAVAAKEQIKTEVKDALRSFFCTDCEKQYSNVAQYDEHIRSYAHTHVVRLKEQQATARQRQAGEAAIRKAKEKKREEKEMKKMAAAAGIKLSSTPSTSSATIVPASQSIIKPAASSGSGFAPVTDVPAKRGGWSVVSTVAESSGGRSFGIVSVSATVPSGFKKTGWTAVGTAPAPAPVSATPEPVSANQTQVTSKAGGGFTRGGWTTLETTNTVDLDTEMASPTTSSMRPVPPPVGSFSVPPPPPPTSAFDPPPPPPDHSLPPPPPPPSDRYEPPPPPPPSDSAPRGQGGYTHNPRSWNSGRRW